jgi:hypothetical protein
VCGRRSIILSAWRRRQAIAAPETPTLQYSIPCDDLREEASGKLLFVGVFDALECGGFPFVLPSMFVVNRWCGGAGEHRERVRLVTGSGEAIAQGRDLRFVLDEETGGCTVATRFTNVSLPGPGMCWVEVFLDGGPCRRYPVVVAASESES